MALDTITADVMAAPAVLTTLDATQFDDSKFKQTISTCWKVETRNGKVSKAHGDGQPLLLEQHIQFVCTT